MSLTSSSWLPTVVCSFRQQKLPNLNSFSPYPHPPCFLRFRISHRENLRYLKTLGIINRQTKPHKIPSPESLLHILSTVDFFKSKGFSDPQFSKLALLCPDIFSPDFDTSEIELVFDFLTTDLDASAEEACGLIYKCPNILQSSVEFCLRPTLDYLRELGLDKLNSPTTLNAHLLNTRVPKLEEKVKFLRSIGFSHEDSERACSRLPAIFGYSIEFNLRPKFDYLVREMTRSVDELKCFPQYFAFSLKKRIAPRHWHLKQRNVEIPLKRMLLWGDQKFYSKWK